ncbi:Leucine Rich Repeat family protein [Histomonas meleagridis]|uniref:Leucine Rich Repeat family protein n=1 Tax=Histomonas meleagridis TaxID=135588 RepID=UPI00355A13E4|nr:Leucine Rich Repeat family protein [Histomonas meleagridis]KAH0804680.1 Leucine Rich Repeat family protein [Histomonas meleagridis]
MKLPNYSFPKSFIDDIKVPVDAMINRIKFVSYTTSRNPPKGLYQLVHKTISNLLKGPPSQKALNLETFSEYPDYIDLVLDALNVFPDIHRVVAPAPFDGGSYWGILADFVAKNQTITTIESYESINSQFKDFADSLSTSQFSKVQSLGFYNNSFGSDFSYSLSKLVSQKNIKALFITNGLNIKGYKMLIPLFKKNLGFQNLTTLSLSDTLFIQFEDIISSLPDLKILYLMNCSLDLSQVFMALSKYPQISLNELRLSGNSFLSPIQSDIILPQQLDTLVLNDVDWNNNAMKMIFVAIDNMVQEKNSANPFFSLSIKHASQSKICWDSFDEFLSTFECKSITKLIYDCNPIQSGFLEFLKKAKSLSFLSMKACFYNGAQFLNDFSKAIALNNSIVNLCISGEGNRFLSDSFPVIINGLCQNKTVKLLDISQNHIGNAIFDLILQLYTSPNPIYELYFDGNSLSDPNKFKSILSEMRQKGVAGKLHLPRGDLNKLRQLNTITQSTLDDIIKLIKEMESDQSIRESLLLQKPQRKNRVTTEQSNGYENSASLSVVYTPSSLASSNNQRPSFTSLPDVQPNHYPYTENMLSEVPQDVIANIASVNKEYISDEGWEASTGRIPKTDFDELSKEFMNNISLDKLCDEISNGK